VNPGDLTAAPACPHADLGREFDPFELAEPFGFHARARERTPIFYSPEIDYWVVTRYADIRDIFRDPATFSSENTQWPFRPRPAEVTQILADGGFTVVSGLSGRQPPEHTRLRGVIKQAFTPRRVASLEPDIRAIATRMIDAFAGRGHADLVAELAHELPALVIFRLLGVPDADVPQVKAWAQSRVLMNFGDRPLDEQQEHAHNLVRYWRYCQELVAARIASPQDDLPGDLARIYLEGETALTTDEIAGLVYTQLTAGHETTTALLSNAFALLLDDRRVWDELCADPERIGPAVEEVLRIGTPVFAWKRVTTGPARIGDTELPAGTKLLLLLGSANHDETVFPDPERIDLDRENASRHLSFGLGIHFCLGAPLARLEARVVLQELTRRLPSLHLVPGQRFTYPPNATFRGPASVAVRFAPERPIVVGFADADPAAVPQLGGKGASLAGLIAAGLPVPPGFVITTAAFDAVRDADGLRDRVAAALARADGSDVAALEAAAADARALVETAPLPAVIERAIRERVRELGEDTPVAVRSSATMEDSAHTSFAGQQDTYLWIVGEDAVLAHVRRCWASVYSARSLAYRRDRGVDEADVGIAVVVQRMVDARAAGVAMTLDPLTGDRTKVVLDAVWGLGETLASGTVTPDNHVVDKVLLQVLSRTVSSKTIELVADPAAGCATERPVDPERIDAPALSDAQVLAVARLAKAAERHHGCPQDVEWALDATGEVFLLQSRPETVWGTRAPAVPASGFATGMSSLTHTLLNPLAARSASHVDH
jgi:cytochrome P450